MRFQFTCIVVLVGLGFLLGGCASSEKDAANKPVVSSMQELRNNMNGCKAAVDKTQAALGELASAPEVKAAYDKLNTAAAELRSSAADLREQAAEMRVKGEIYIAQWKDEMDQITDPEIKASAAKRREAVAANFSKIRESAGAARTAYNTYDTSLTAIQTTLKNDLTHGGVSMLANKVKKTRAEGDTLKQELDKLVGELEGLRSGMSTTRPVAQ